MIISMLHLTIMFPYIGHDSASVCKICLSVCTQVGSGKAMILCLEITLQAVRYLILNYSFKSSTQACRIFSIVEKPQLNGLIKVTVCYSLCLAVNLKVLIFKITLL